MQIDLIVHRVEYYALKTSNHTVPVDIMDLRNRNTYCTTSNI